MATNSLSALSALRMSGLASGMDTESMVESLMRVERLKYDRLTQQKTLMDWKKDANLGVNNLLRTFRDDYFSMLKPENYMMNQSSVLIYKVTMDSSAAVKISAGKDALNGSHTINSITSLAAGAGAVSATAVSEAALSLDTELSDLALSTPLTFDGGQLSFLINGQSFTFESSDTLRTLINRVNSDSKANVQMSYSSLTGKFSIVNKTLGSDSSLVIANAKGNAFAASGAAFGIAAGTSSNGADAVLSIDGIAVVKKTNSFTIDGVNYTLTGTTGSAVKFSVEQDIDAAVAKVKKFVEAYNELAGKLEDMLDEERNADYTPLTDEQKEQMSDTQVEKWEKLAKSGMLHGDSYIKSLLQNLRRGFYDNVADTNANAASVGLGTFSYLTKGMIQVDEAKLRTALQNDPQKVARVLSGTSSSADAATKQAESGLAARMQSAINNYINDYQGYRTDSIDSQYDRLADSMDRAERLLQAKQERYWKQFTRMEQALSRMNSQSSWLSQQLPANG